MGTSLYHGFCTRCMQPHSLRTDADSMRAAKQLCLLLDHYKRFDFESQRPEPCFSTDYVWTKGPGRMMGVLITQDPATRTKHVLKAFSGQMTERWDCPGWCGPVAGIVSSSPVYMAARMDIEQLSNQLAQLEASFPAPSAATQEDNLISTSMSSRSQQPQAKRFRHLPKAQTRQQHWPDWARQQFQLLVAQRRSLSHQLMAEVQASYITSDRAGRRISLLNVYQDHASTHQEADTHDQLSTSARVTPSSKRTRTSKASARQGFPAGTGDCCAPKLLHAAAQQGLVPISLCEFWYGSPPSTNTPQGVAAAARRAASPDQNGPGLSLSINSLTSNDSRTRRAGSEDVANVPSACQTPEDQLCTQIFSLFDNSHPDVPNAASRMHAFVYPACEKCQTILGAMLCHVA